MPLFRSSCYCRHVFKRASRAGDDGDVEQRAPHAGCDGASRSAKAQKLIALLSRHAPLVGRSVLEIGCGSGHIAAALAVATGADGSVRAVDLVDQRLVTAGYDFDLVESSLVPFPDASFDIVVSNHVLEHVGGRQQQLEHLSEIRRVLRPEGIGYLAVPNRWSLVEPHYKLPLLSWLPLGLASRYVRVARRGTWYDVVPPGPRMLRNLVQGVGLRATDVTFDVLGEMRRVERGGRVKRWVLGMPRWVFNLGRPVVPTMVLLVSRDDVGQPSESGSGS